MITDEMKCIIYLGLLWNGAAHDFTLFKAECQEMDFITKRIWVDLGFQGIKEKNKNGMIHIPHKKPKGQELTAQQKEENKAQSKRRIVIENAFAGMKRYYILKHKCRLRTWSKINDAIELCAGLWNFKVNRKVKCLKFN